MKAQGGRTAGLLEGGGEEGGENETRIELFLACAAVHA